MKTRLIALASLAALTLGFTSAQTTLKVGASPVPHAEILEFIQPALAEEGLNLEIIVFTDYVQPNLALDNGDIDANYFQHVPYQEQFSADHGLKLTALGGVHVEPIGLYSDKHASLDELPEGAQIGIPNDPSNAGRALLLLQAAGLLELAENAGLDATPLDITANPKNFRFVELEAAQLPRSLADTAASVINTNYALEAGLNPLEDALVIEGADSPYVNVLTVRAGEEDNPAFSQLLDALTSEAVREFIEETYEGAVVATF